MSCAPGRPSSVAFILAEQSMTSMTKELRRLSYSLLLRGAAMLALGLSAIIWPEPVLIAAMFTVGVIAVLFGLYEASIAIAIRRRTPRWWIVLAHGAATFLFGLLSVGGPGLSLRLALIVIASWFIFYSLIAWTSAMMVPPGSALRRTLIAWGCVDAGLAVLTLVYPAATIFVLLFFGAVYAALFGAWQLAAGLWLRKQLQRHGSHSHVAVFATSHS
jgi:uncharacterized membrane protein HdeD (DUF308 family)